MHASVGEAAKPGQLALQYWFFYLFNDYNDKHEGDWEMIQLDFAASDPAQALTQTPDEIGYSQHEGAERAHWGDSKLEVVDGTHPVVYPAAGSHANYYEPASVPRPERSAGCRLRRDDRSVPRAASYGRSDPDRPVRVSRGISLARVRRPLGGGAARLLQRADRAEHEAPVDGADHLGGDLLARHELHGPRGNRHRFDRDRFLLRGRSPRARIC